MKKLPSGYVAYLDQRQAHNEITIDGLIDKARDFLHGHDDDVALTTAHMEHLFGSINPGLLAALTAGLLIRLVRTTKPKETS